MSERRKALLVGINSYNNGQNLNASVKDASDMAELLEYHGGIDGTKGDRNFDCKLVTSENFETDNTTVRAKIEEWFNGEADVALFFFSGHGVLTSSGGKLVTSDAEKFNEGILMSEVLTLANKATREKRHKEVVIIADCCHSGDFGNTDNSNLVTIEEGVTILTASGKDEEAKEGNQNGVFTSLLLEALDGGAADILGKISIASIYAYADQLLGVWDQRPRLKSNAKNMVSLRNDVPKIEKARLRKIINYFLNKDDGFPLNRTYEPFDSDGVSKNPEAIDENVEVFKDLQKYNRFGLVEPYGLPADKNHMYYAAIMGTGCRLTVLGKFYWKMAKRKRF